MRLTVLLLILAVLFTVPFSALAASDMSSVPDIDLPRMKLPGNEAVAFVQKLQVGWNLGGALESYKDPFPGNDLTLESYWSGVTTTENVIDTVYASGYNTIRIPVSWHNHVTGVHDDINVKWMDRVQEIVDWAIKRNLYVIINCHHDLGDDFIKVTSDGYARSAEYLTNIWTQIADRFASYDDHLIFEGMNEPRLVGSMYEWQFEESSIDCQDAADCINRLNQVFVDTVRSRGGYNTDRYLMIPSYAASPFSAVSNTFRLPADTVLDRLIVSTHAYLPYTFAMDAQGETLFMLNDTYLTDFIDGFMNQMYARFVANGIPVIIGEFGSVNKNNLQDRVNFTAYYVAAARQHNMPCLIWDNAAFRNSDELFGLMDRRRCTWTFPEIIDAMIRYGRY